ncbi:hypothetical protein ACAG24_011665 [Mycobacterium sp. pW049]|uniref:hypothetical protein n=1 Tax=[Mycobacterium] bulgaricum TaxID=3238985 RepID=UPI00351AB8CE
MQSTVNADQNRRFWSSPTTSSRGEGKLMAAGIALAGAAVLSVPVAVDPAIPTLRALTERQVELSAFQNPFTAWQNVIATGATNLRDRTEDIFSRGIPALLASSPGLAEDFAEVVRNLLTDPAAGKALAEALPGFGETIRKAIADTPAAIQGQLDLFPVAWQEATAKLEAGDIFGFVHRLDVYAVYALRAFTPIRTIFTIPGDVAALLGSPDLERVLDGVLTGRVVSGYAESALSPMVGALFAATEVFESVVDAVKAGDFETLVSELINAPAKVTGAFFNGIQLKYFPDEPQYFMPGLLSAGGPIDRFLVSVPEALKALVNPAPANPAAGSLAKVSSSDISASGDVVTLSLDTGDAHSSSDKASLGGAEGSDDTPAVIPAADESEDETVVDGAEDETVVDGAEEDTVADGAEDETVADGAEDETVAEGADDDAVADGADDDAVDAGTDTSDAGTDTSDSSDTKSGNEE